MDHTEFRAALKSLGIRQNWLAERVGMKPQVVNRWATGEVPVPPWMPFLIQLLRDSRIAPASSSRPPAI